VGLPTCQEIWLTVKQANENAVTNQGHAGQKSQIRERAGGKKARSSATLLGSRGQIPQVEPVPEDLLNAWLKTGGEEVNVVVPGLGR